MEDSPRYGSFPFSEFALTKPPLAGKEEPVRVSWSFKPFMDRMLNHRARAAGAPLKSLPASYVKVAGEPAVSPITTYLPPVLCRFSLGGIVCIAMAVRQKVGLWLPVNIRQQSAVGFGNGTSRIRLYPRYDDRASLLSKCREIRRQVSWSNRHGEWATPTKFPLASLPPWATRPLLRAYLKRPGIDMATGVFSTSTGGRKKSAKFFSTRKKWKVSGNCTRITPGNQRRNQRRPDMADLHLRSRSAIN